MFWLYIADRKLPRIRGYGIEILDPPLQGHKLHGIWLRRLGHFVLSRLSTGESAQPAWILPDGVHYVAGHHDLVVLAPFHLCQAQKIFDDCHKKPFSVSSFMAPDIDPMAQHKVLQLAHDHALPST